MAEGIRQHSERAQRGLDRVEIFDLLVEIAFCGRIKLGRPPALDQHLQENSEEIEVFLRGRKREGIDFEIPGREANAHVGAAEQLGQAFKASAQIKDEGVRRILLHAGDQKIQQERLARAGTPQDHGVRDVTVMEIQEIRRVMIGLEDRQILRAEMAVARIPGSRVNRKEKSA